MASLTIQIDVTDWLVKEAGSSYPLRDALERALGKEAYSAAKKALKEAKN